MLFFAPFVARKMKRFECVARIVICAVFAHALLSTGAHAFEGDELRLAHQPVKIAAGHSSAFMLFLLNGDDLSIWLFSDLAGAPSLMHVKTIRGVDSVESVFFYRWQKSGDKTVHVLTKIKSDSPTLIGDLYSTLSLDILRKGAGIELLSEGAFAYELVNCFEGKDTELSKDVECRYKNAAAIKEFISRILDR